MLFILNPMWGRQWWLSGLFSGHYSRFSQVPKKPTRERLCDYQIRFSYWLDCLPVQPTVSKH